MPVAKTAQPIARLGMAGVAPVKQISMGRQKVALTPAETEALQRQDATMLHGYLTGVIDSEDWKSLNDDERREVIQRVQRNIAKSRAGRLMQMRESQQPE